METGLQSNKADHAEKICTEQLSYAAQPSSRIMSVDVGKQNRQHMTENETVEMKTIH
jgi:hypothetical protein